MDATAAKALDDLVLLDEISDESACAHLKARFLRGDMYCWSGPTLIAINPYKVLTVPGRAVSLYDPSVLATYIGASYIEVPPHVFAVASEAYAAMLRDRTPSSITISGESGSGKTESAKQCLLFIAHVSGAKLGKPPPAGAAAAPPKAPPKPGAPAAAPAAAPASAAPASAAALVKDRLLTSTLLLEAFGNASTLRNHNSSRFGKLSTVFFSSSGVAVGGRVDTYLLEKTRVVRQQAGERAFHVLYYLCAGLGATPEGRTQLRLQPPAAFAYLSREHRKVPGLNDAAMFRTLVACANSCGISAPQQAALWRALAVVLHLGNVALTSPAEREAADARDAAEQRAAAAEVAAAGGGGGGVDAAVLLLPPDAAGGGGGAGKGAVLNAQASVLDEDSPESAAAIGAVCALLGVTPPQLAAALTHRTIAVGGASTATLLTAPQARAARDSLAKRIYEVAFGHVVGLVNRAISLAPAASDGDGGGAGGADGGDATSPTPPAQPDESLSIRLLDLYGFETFPDPQATRFNQVCVCRRALRGGRPAPARARPTGARPIPPYALNPPPPPPPPPHLAVPPCLPASCSC